MIISLTILSNVLPIFKNFLVKLRNLSLFIIFTLPDFSVNTWLLSNGVASINKMTEVQHDQVALDLGLKHFLLPADCATNVAMPGTLLFVEFCILSAGSIRKNIDWKLWEILKENYALLLS